jgi:hypothetical protein
MMGSGSYHLRGLKRMEASLGSWRLVILRPRLASLEEEEEEEEEEDDGLYPGALILESGARDRP